MSYKAMIFDLDGTLIHTMPKYRYRIVGQTLDELGITSHHRYIDQFWFGSKRDEIIKRNFQVKPEIFWKTYEKYDNAELRKKFTKAYEDTNIVSDLKKKGMKTGIVTGAPPHVAEIELGILGKKNFDTIVIANTKMGLKPKPHPMALKKCLEALNMKHSEALYVGNSDEDIIMAKKAKVFDVLIHRGEHQFLGEKATLTIQKLKELRNILE